MGKDFLRRFGKELTLLVAGWLVREAAIAFASALRRNSSDGPQ
jgi:hypothetical protein